MERGELADVLGVPRPGAAQGNRVVEEQDPAAFMAAFGSAVSAGGNVFLANPSWRQNERSVLGALTEMQVRGGSGWLMIPSGGSGGALKFSRHDGRTVAAAVGGFRAHFGMRRVNAVGVLPLHHVSGLMAWMRSLLSGGTYLPWSWKEVEGGVYPRDLPEDCCLSLVPTQLQRLLASPASVAWLRGFRVIFVGGGPAWSALLEEGARLRLPLSPCYGATETAAMVSALRPEQFLGGMRGCGSPLPHARIDVAGGVLRISGESVHRGYFPGEGAGRSWTSDDLGMFTADGSLAILGRRDDVIVTGGQKVSPPEVEAALMLSGEFEDVAVVGLPDPEWGHVVVACHPQGARAPRMPEVEAALSGLAPYKRPKRYVAIAEWPRSPQGKIDRGAMAKLASKVGMSK